ncbi:MAG: Crp/Fnr family transcriptional regulator [Bdellovibrionota bacterium]
MSCGTRLHSLFSDLDASLINELDVAKEVKTYSKGDYLFQENDACHGMFCISVGSVKLFKEGQLGKQSLLRIVNAGGVLGMRASIANQNYKANAQALESTKVCRIPQSFFLNLMRRDPELSLKVSVHLATSLSQTEEMLSDLINQNVRQRVGHLIFSLSANYGKHVGKKVVIELPLTRAEMASMIGTTPETVMRVLSDFEQHGYTSMEKKKIIIEDEGRLLREIEHFDH